MTRWLVPSSEVQSRRTVISVLGQAELVGLLMISPELEEFASNVLKKETAAAKERRKIREKRAGVPPAGGKK